jgi:hypothetical protein
VLTVDDVVPFLIENGLIDAEDVVLRGIEVKDVARRNLNLRVSSLLDAKGYIVKQPDPSELSTHETLSREAQFYSWCDERGLLGGDIPKFFGYFAAHCALVLGLLRNTRSLREVILSSARTGEHAHTTRLGRALGDTLARVHCVLNQRLRPAASFSDSSPWALSIHLPTPETLGRLSPANTEFIRIIQGDLDLCAALDQLRRGWCVNGVIHGDIKSDNVLVSEAGGVPAITVVDWELIQGGDLAWDVGGTLHDFLLLWVQSMPMSNRDPNELLAEAEVPLGQLRPLIRQFWSAYEAGFTGWNEAPIRYLERAVGFAGARMLQSTYELSATAGELCNHAIAMLQVAAHLLTNGAEASLSLLGISPLWLLSPLKQLREQHP